MGDWWESVVRIRAPHTIGSGTLIAPDVIVTAAHVVSERPGKPPVAVDELRAVTMYGVPIVFRVVEIRVASLWLADDATARLNDVATLHVDAVDAATLPRILDFGQEGVPFSCSAFGYIGDNLVQAHFRTGECTREGLGFTSTSIDPDDGMSGGALVTREDAPRLVGVIRSHASTSAPAGIIALPLVSSVLNPLLP